ncbi:hypothetical protein D3C73_901500 [compost metagenome]
MLVRGVGYRAVRQRIPFGTVRDVGHAAFEADSPFAVRLAPFHTSLRILAAPVDVQPALAAECRVILTLVDGQEAVRYLLFHFLNHYFFFPDDQLVHGKRLANHQLMRNIHIAVCANLQCKQAFVLIVELSMGMQSIRIAAAAGELFPLLSVRDIGHITVGGTDLPGFCCLIPGNLRIGQRLPPVHLKAICFGYKAPRYGQRLIHHNVALVVRAKHRFPVRRLKLAVGMKCIGIRTAVQLLPIRAVGHLEHAAACLTGDFIGSDHPGLVLLIPQQSGAGLVFADHLNADAVILTGIFIERDHIPANDDLRDIQYGHASADLNPAFGGKRAAYRNRAGEINIPGIADLKRLLAAGSDRK